MSTWTGRSALVTGAGGFIGSHLVEDLVEAGARVRALVRYNSRNDLGMLQDLPAATLAQVEVVSGDVTDPHQMLDLVRGADCVFHLAALIGIPYSYRAAHSYVEVNVGGTLNLLEAARRAQVPRFIQVSSSEVYGSAQELPMAESHPLHPQSPYAATKVGADLLALTFHLSHGLPALVVRPFNTYGPRQSQRAVIPSILAQLLEGVPVRVGALEPRRDLTYVADTASGLRLAAESDLSGEVVNLGTGCDHSIQEIAELAAQVVGRPLELEFEEQRLRPAASEVTQLRSDPGRAQKKLGWSARHDLESGLTLTAAWVSANLDRFRAGLYLD